MILIPVMILLFAAWVLWAWIVSDHFNIAWLRKWCAILFTLTAVLISAGAGVGITMTVIKARHRQQIRDFAEAIEKQLSEGKTETALMQIRSVIHPPDEFSDASADLLDRMLTATQKLQNLSTRTQTAESVGRQRQ